MTHPAQPEATTSDEGLAGSAGEAPESSSTDVRWPQAALSRPIVVAGDHGVVPVGHAAALDWAIATVADVWRQLLNRPLALTGTADVGAASQADHLFAVIVRDASNGTDTLISFDSSSIRSLVNAVTSDQEGLMSPVAPGPSAGLTAAEFGVAEYLVLQAVDQVLRRASLNDTGPVIEAMLDGAQAEQWLARHETRCVPLTLNLGGVEGFVRLFIAGWKDVQWSAVFAIGSALGRVPATAIPLPVHLALPAFSMQPDEMRALETGDVILLGASDLTTLPQGCELVTPTNWRIADATIIEDTPTHIDVAVRACTPTFRPAAMLPEAIQPTIGDAQLVDTQFTSVERLQLVKSANAPVSLWHGACVIGHGELVIIGRELAVRIVELTAAT